MFKKLKLLLRIHCMLILILSYIMLAYLSLSKSLFNAACIYNACLYMLVYFFIDFWIAITCTMLFVSMLCLWVNKTYVVYFSHFLYIMYVLCRNSI